MHEMTEESSTLSCSPTVQHLQSGSQSEQTHVVNDGCSSSNTVNTTRSGGGSVQLKYKGFSFLVTGLQEV